MVHTVPEAEIPAILHRLLGNPEPAAVELCVLLTRKWADRDPLSAAAWAVQLSGDPFHSEALRQVAVVWAGQDLTAAMDWAKALPEGLNKESTLIGLAYEAARSEPLAGVELIRALPPAADRDDLLVYALAQWAASDWRQALEWAGQVSDSSLRERMLSEVALATAEQDGAAAAALVVGSLASGPQQDRAAVAVAQRWVQGAPSEVAAWVAQFPEGSTRDAALENVAQVWGERDPAAATAWLNSLRGSPSAELSSAFVPAVAEVPDRAAADTAVERR
jgi:hypothetical protein